MTMIDNRKSILTIIMALVYIISSSCKTKSNFEFPYDVALKTLSEKDTILKQIFFDGASLNYDNKRIKIYGFINKKESIFYGSSDFTDPLLDNEVFKDLVSIKLYENYKVKKLLDLNNCKADEHLIELQGTFHVKKTTNNEVESYYMTNIDRIYDFDTRPKGIGTGKKYLCYSFSNENTS